MKITSQNQIKHTSNLQCLVMPNAGSASRHRAINEQSIPLRPGDSDCIREAPISGYESVIAEDRTTF